MKSAMGLRASHSISVLALCESLESRLLLSTFTVTNVNDSGSGSFRQAIIDSLNAPTSDQIVFDANVFSVPRVISLQSSLPDLIGTTLQIIGPGSSLLTIHRDAAAPRFGIFRSGLLLTLSGMTISGGDGFGGGALTIYSHSQAILENVVLADNRGDEAGAIFVGTAGALTVRNSTISGNTGIETGGGIYFYDDGCLLIENSTISGNTSPDGGGIEFSGSASCFPDAGYTPGTLIIRNSTISNNTTTGSGGGIQMWNLLGLLQIENSTISGNTADGGGGIYLSGPGSMTIQSSTITANTSTSTDQDYGGGGVLRNTPFGVFPASITVTNSVISGNNNANSPDIKVDAQTNTNVNFSAIGSPNGFSFSPTSGNNLPLGANLLLGSLSNNGGPTRTMLPSSFSPLIGAGSNAAKPSTLITDQRGPGFPRIFGASIDIGAIEAQPLPYPVASATASNVSTSGATTYTFTVTYTDAGAANNGINASTLIGNHNAVRVAGSDGFSVSASYVSINNPANGTPRTVTYSFSPPGGSWDGPDGRSYTIYMQSGQVKDLDGIAVPAGAIGSFSVKIPQTFTVTTANESGPGSLRDAIDRANAAPAADTITFSLTLFNSPQVITLSSSLPKITDDLTITGPGAALLNVRRDLADIFNPFGLLSSMAGNLNISGITFSGGDGYYGGGLLIEGNSSLVSLDGVVFTHNTSWQGGGGAIAVFGSVLVAIRNSTISDNTNGPEAYPGGGGIFYFQGGSLLLENSTLSGNSAANAKGQGDYFFGGGAIFFAGPVSTQNAPGFVPGSLVIRNSTINNNSSAYDGGAIYLNAFDGNLLIENSTITGNTAAHSGSAIALGSGPGSIVLHNSTITTNTANASTPGDGGAIARNSTSPGNITALNSIISANTNSTAPDILANSATTTNINYSAIGSPTGFTMSASSGNNLPFSANLLLGPLQNNGGPTQTILPSSGSPLINAASTSSLTTDQRGFPRIIGSRPDIGAAEYFIPGDLNFDGTVSIADFITLAANFNKTGVTYADGDLNYDGTVSISDFIDLAAAFGNSLGTPPPAAAPQPASPFSVQTHNLFSATRHAHRRHVKHHHVRPRLFRFDL
jgi:hypothetical protein